MSEIPRGQLLIGVDGGGSKTDAVLAQLEPGGKIRILDQAQSGPSNLRLAGREMALASLDEAVGQVMNAVRDEGRKADYAVLGLAGSTDSDVHAELEQWARQTGFFEDFAIIHDVEPVLVAGTPRGFGVAVIVGTGSVASGVDESGRARTCGGWGHWFGDQGSGYDLGRAALEAASQIDDGVGRPSVIHQRLLEHFGIAQLREVMQVLAASPNVRQSIAAAAPVVIQAAEDGDVVALEILNEGARQLMRTVQPLVNALAFEDGFPIALAGSVVCHNRIYRDLILEQLGTLKPAPGEATLVTEPVKGCLEIARMRLLKT